VTPCSFLGILFAFRGIWVSVFLRKSQVFTRLNVVTTQKAIQFKTTTTGIPNSVADLQAVMFKPLIFSPEVVMFKPLIFSPEVVMFKPLIFSPEVVMSCSHSGCWILVFVVVRWLVVETAVSITAVVVVQVRFAEFEKTNKTWND